MGVHHTGFVLFFVVVFKGGVTPGMEVTPELNKKGSAPLAQ